MTTPGTRLKVLRMKRSLGLTEAARLVGMQRQQWEAYESDEKHPRHDTTGRIAVGLGFSPSELHWYVTGVFWNRNRLSE